MTVRTCYFLSVLSISMVLVGSSVRAWQSVERDKVASPVEEFNSLFEQWKGILGRLREIRTDYKIAEKSEFSTLREEFDRLMKEGHLLVSRIREVGIKAYQQSPDENPQISEFLVSMLSADVQSDNHESAYPLAKVLIEEGHDDKRLWDWGGIAALATNHFNDAGRWLPEAHSSGNISNEGAGFLVEVENYKELWKAEQAVRQREKIANDLPRIKLVTNKGQITLELFENEAPQTVGNIVYLVEKGFYNGLTFHRVLNHFMAQGGCPEGSGFGGPGYNIYCECYRSDHRKHFRGSLSMAKSQPRDTGGSQFFLTFVPTPGLNGAHTVFGRVIDGMEVLSKIQRRDPNDPQAPQPDRIISATVLRKRDHDYVPTKVR